jgi:type II secretory pathway component PulL
VFSGSDEKQLFFLYITDCESQILEFYLAFLVEDEIFSDSVDFYFAIVG